MQDLIREGFFGDQYHPDMILSVNTGKHNLFHPPFNVVLVAYAPFCQFLRLSVAPIPFTLSGRSRLALQTSDSSL